MKKHSVKFLSPGTFVSEQSTLEIDSWDIKKAVQMSKTITERHGAKPYGFRFVTRERKKNELDSKEVKWSGIYYLGGKILTLEDVVDRNDPNDKILISNMRINEWDKKFEHNGYTKIFDRKIKSNIIKKVIKDYGFKF